MRELRIGKNDAGQRLDKFLNKALKTLPPALLYKSIRLKKIKVNRKRATPSQILSEGDSLQLFLSEEFFQKEGRGEPGDALSRIRPNLSLVYEDENIMLINKHAGISVHEDEGGSSATLIDQIQAYLYQKGEYDPQNEQTFKPSLCNRIDRNTQGIVIAAKNAEALRIMDEKIRQRELNKYYLAVVHGTPKEPKATLKHYLKKDEKQNMVQVYPREVAGSKEILTRYRVVESKGSLSLVEVELLTGRTHQIRAHMAYIGHPLLGDGKYGVNKADRKMGYQHQALCSYRLKFCFQGEATLLEYLNGKEFTVPREQIDFVRDLFTP